MGGGEEGDDVKSRRVIVEARAVCNISSKRLGGQMRAHLDDQRNGGIDSNKINVTWNLQNGSEGGVAENGGTEARCPVCCRSFHSEKAMYGHMRCHPEREWRGVNPPPSAKTASFSSVSLEIDGLSHSSITSTVVSSDTVPSLPPPRWAKTGRRGQNRIITSYSTRGSSCNIRSLHKEGNLRDNPSYKCRTCKKTFPSYQALIGNRSSHSYNKKSLNIENQYVSSSDTSASKGEGLALGTSKQVVKKAHKCRTCNKTFTTGQALGGHQTTDLPKSTPLATPKRESLILSAEEASHSTGRPRVMDFNLNEHPSMEEE